MRKNLLVIVFSFSLITLQASPILGTKPYTRQDTTRAVQQLFTHKRLTGRISSMVGSCYLIAGAIALPVGAVGVCQTSFGLIRQTRFRHTREATILTAYQKGTPLPRRIERRLKARYFL